MLHPAQLAFSAERFNRGEIDTTLGLVIEAVVDYCNLELPSETQNVQQGRWNRRQIRINCVVSFNMN